MRHVAFAAAVLAIATVACGTPIAPAEPRPPRHALRVPFDSAWAAAVGFFTGRKFPVETMDRASGSLVSARFPVSGTDSATWVRCPSITTKMFESAPPTRRLTGAVKVDLHAEGETTIARVTLAVTALDQKPPSADSTGLVTIDCASTGVLEAAILAHLRAAGNQMP